MPYLTKQRKTELETGDRMRKAGDLNYALTMVALDFLAIHGKSYETLNAVVGALESAKAEFQRRVVAPYETLKAIENGDVYNGA